MGAWLGTGAVAHGLRKFRPYDEAIEFVHALGLKSEGEWRAYRRGDRKDLPPKPGNIPSNPHKIYGEEFRKRGGVGGWLGTRYVAHQHRSYRSYDDAIKFVHALALKSINEWTQYCRDERKDLPPKPDDIPKAPYDRYGEQFREKGGWRAWLGTSLACSKMKRSLSKIK
jgi:hypothetical protein